MSELQVEAAVPPAEDAEVTARWQRLGIPGLADVHTHFLPPRMLRRVWAHFDETGPLIGRAWPITYRWSEADRVAHLRALGVWHFTALPYAHRPGMAVDLTEWALEFADRTPECAPSATFFPEPGVLDYVRSALDRGAAVFKVHVQVGGFDLRDEVLDAVWGVLAEAGVPVVIHAGSGPVPRAGLTGPEPLAGVLRRHPRLTAVVAHMGAPEYEGFIEIAERYPRVHLDTTMVFTDFFEETAPFPRALLPRLADLQDRVVLGSDFPNLPYPYAHQLEALERLEMGDDWLRDVLWHNGFRLIGASAVR
ncbi:MAG: amidohydrolase family protein [Actinomycetota bacterium]